MPSFLATLVEIMVYGVLILVIVGVLVFALVLFPLFSRKEKKRSVLPDRSPLLNTDPFRTAHQKELAEEEEEQRRLAQAAKPPKKQWWEKFPDVGKFEILYWRGVSKPWWWNNYAEELVQYARDYLPHKKLDLYQDYNSNSKGNDYRRFKDRILHLKPHKVSKHPLVVTDYDKDYRLVASHSDLEYMKDWIDALWYRHYKSSKTYRPHPSE